MNPLKYITSLSRLLFPLNVWLIFIALNRLFNPLTKKKKKIIKKCHSFIYEMNSKARETLVTQTLFKIKKQLFSKYFIFTNTSCSE